MKRIIHQLLILTLVTWSLCACGGSSAIGGNPPAGPGPGTGDPTGLDALEQSMIDMHNNTRAGLGLQQLTPNALLSQIAQQQADYMLSIGQMSHEDASGGQVWDRAAAVGYADITGENVAYGINVSSEMIYNGWINSPPHYQNITLPEYAEIGMGVAISGSTQYWCATFGRPRF